jgi:hypothetical protein
MAVGQDVGGIEQLAMAQPADGAPVAIGDEDARAE